MKKKLIFTTLLGILFFVSTTTILAAGAPATGQDSSSPVDCINGSLYSTSNTDLADTNFPPDIGTPGKYCIQENITRPCGAGSASYITAVYVYSGNSFNQADLYPVANGTCTDGAHSAQSYESYFYPAVSVSLTANPTTINQGEGGTSSALTPRVLFNGESVDGGPLPSGLSCSIDNGVGTYTGTNGPFSVSPGSSTTYTLSCSYNGATPATSQATVSVVAPLQNNVMCSVSPTSVAQNQNVTWTSTVTGGTPPFTYSWIGDGFLSGQTSANPSGSYSIGGTKSGAVTVTDSSNVPKSQTVTSHQNTNYYCNGSDTGYMWSEVDDGDTPNEQGSKIEAVSDAAGMETDPNFGPADFHANPQNYCIQENLTNHYCTQQECVTTVKDDLFTGGISAGQGPDGAQVYGAMTWTVTNGGSGPQQVTQMCSNTVNVTGGNPPSPPVLTCPATGNVGQTLTFGLSAVDPNGLNVRYGVDWDNNGSIDAWKPVSGYTLSGNTLNFTNSWPSPGTYTIGGVAMNSKGYISATSTCSVTISNAQPDLTAALVSGQENLTGTVGVPVSVEATISNIGTGPTGAPFPDTFWANSTQSESGANAQYAEFMSGEPGPGNPPPGGFAAGANEIDGPQVPIQFTFPTAGTYYYRICANQDQTGAFGVNESNTANNCSAWGTITITNTNGSVTCTDNASNPVAPGTVVNFTATPTSPATSPYTWSMNGSPVSGTKATNSFTIPSNAQTGDTYLMTVQATNATGNYSCSPTVTVNAGVGECTGDQMPKITANGQTPSIIVAKGSTPTIAWDATNTGGTCTITGPGVNQNATCNLPTGSANPTVNTQSIYTITCTGGGSSTVVVNVAPKFTEF